MSTSYNVSDASSSSVVDDTAPRYPVCNNRFVTTRPMTIILKECLKFHDENGNLMFNLHARTMTMSGRIIIKDANGVRVGHVRGKRRPAARATYYFGDKKKDKIGTVKAKGPTSRSDRCDADIYIGDTLIGETMGNWFTKSFRIVISGVQVAEIYRTIDSAEGGFSIEILTEGVDSLVILLIVMALGEIHAWADTANGGVSSCILYSGKT